MRLVFDVGHAGRHLLGMLAVEGECRTQEPKRKRDDLQDHDDDLEEVCEWDTDISPELDALVLEVLDLLDRSGRAVDC